MTDEFDQLNALAKEEAMNHPDDIGDAVEAVLARAKRTKWFPPLAASLIERAVRGIVCDCRHQGNREMRNKSGDYGGPAKVTSAGSAVAEVCRTFYTYMIAGRSLGSILGEELEGIADAETERAEGCMFNVKLANKLKPLVPEGKTVKQSVSAAKLKKIFEEL